jgi:hypothetical protein
MPASHATRRDPPPSLLEPEVSLLNRRLFGASLAAALALSVAACAHSNLVADTRAPLPVRNATELVAALQPANAGRRIELAAGEYPVDQPLTVPDGTTLVGAGAMTFDNEGLPAGLPPGQSTTLRVTAAFEGSVLSLGNGSRLERLRVLDLETRPPEPLQRHGNVVSVLSRAPGDTIDASIVECELVNPNPLGFTDDGPKGYGVLVLTLNPMLGAPPAAHEGARISVTLQRSKLQSDLGAALFANNFAAGGEITMLIEGNRLEGGLMAGGGTSRPDKVQESVTRLSSRNNLYRRAGFDRHGWLLIGASSSPHHDDRPGQGAARNVLHIDSSGDRIEGFRVGIRGSAARRIGAGRQPLEDNRLELNIERLRIRTEGDGAADLQLWAAWSAIAQAQGPAEFPAGDRNVLRATIRDSYGSGRRQNAFDNVFGPRRPGNGGAGNKLEIEGSRAGFIESNLDFDPLPSPEFFIGAGGA